MHKSETFSLWIINGQECFAIFSLFMMNLDAKFDPIAILGFLKRMNGLDFARGEKSPNLMMNDLNFFCKYLKIHNKSTAEI